jgi:sarcosine oxidase subunit beta
MAHPGKVVIAGAGVIGASCAWHLTRLGVKDVLLLDQGAAPGAGSTGRATGGFRAQYGSAINIRLSLLAREQLLRFERDTGVDPQFLQAGYLWLARTQGDLAALQTAWTLQQREGLREARIIEAREAARLNPFVSTDGVLGAAFSPTDGFMRPLEILRGFLEGAQRLGAQVRFGARVTGLGLAQGQRVAQVRTTAGEFDCDQFIDAGGPWAAQIARLAGVDLPVTPLRRQVACTAPTAALPATLPMTLWCDDAFHLRVRDGRVLLLRPTPGNPADVYDTSVEPAWLDAIEATTRERVPGLAGVPLDRAQAWGGLYEESPDHHALLGLAPGTENLWLCNGSSGHGVMHSPALGLLLAERLLFGEFRSLDARALRPERFAEGEPVAGSAVL